MNNIETEQKNTSRACFEELRCYCEQKNHSGALMLAGKWGSGKTYLLKHDLKETLKNTHVLVFVSLFGISSVEELKRAVKTSWLSQIGFDSKKLQKGQALLGQISNVLSNVEKIRVASNIAKGVLAINFIDFVTVQNTIEDKKVVLIFDDLERSTLNTRDVLGVMNDYCENQEFPVIIVANEENIKRPVEEQGMSYDEIKEKIVQKTVYLEPDYRLIIPGLINVLTNEDDYREFLHQLENRLIQMLSGYSPEGVRLDDIGIHNCKAGDRYKDQADARKEEQRKRALLEQRPHNIRIVKTAILEFNRVFRLLNEYQRKDREKWFFSFLIVSIMIKTGLAKESPEYHWIFLHTDISVLFPGYYDSKCMHNSLLTWLSKGIWDEDSFIRYLESIRIEEKNMNDPKYQIRHWLINGLDEDVITKEFPAVVEDSYAGNLTLTEYAITILNSAIAREYSFILPVEIDWPRFDEGIIRRIEALAGMDRGENEIDEALHHIHFSSSKNLSDEERYAWSLIKDCEDNKNIFFTQDKNRFLDYLRTDYHAAFRYAIGKEFCRFDEEMATGIYDTYHMEDNIGKYQIVQECEKWFPRLRKNSALYQEESIKGFAKLEGLLTSLLSEYEEKAFSRAYTEHFLAICQEVSSLDMSTEEGS